MARKRKSTYYHRFVARHEAALRARLEEIARALLVDRPHECLWLLESLSEARGLCLQLHAVEHVQTVEDWNRRANRREQQGTKTEG